MVKGYGNLETVNDYLVSVFNDILVIEESELKNLNSKTFQLPKCIPSKPLGCTKKDHD